jgi:hypothetical protein
MTNGNRIEGRWQFDKPVGIGAQCTGTWKPSGLTVEHIIGNGNLQTVQ